MHLKIRMRFGGGGESRRRAGFSLLELLIALVALTVGLLGFARAVVSSISASQAGFEAAKARAAAQATLEALTDEDLSSVFALYNATGADDPGGPGTAPGSNFAVEGLAAAVGDPDGLAGEIVFPASDASPGVLREDWQEDNLGTPRDLNADGVVDALDHAGDYVLLPVLVRVEWRRGTGTNRVELRALLGGLQ